MFKTTFTLSDEGEYLAPNNLGWWYSGVEMICGYGLINLFNFEYYTSLPKKITLFVTKEKPKKRRGWFKAKLTSEYDSEFSFVNPRDDREKDIPIYRDLMTFVMEETGIEEGEEFWFSLEY